MGWSSLTALSEESRARRNERVAQKRKHNLTITQRNDTKLLYKGELQREEVRGGGENGWESRAERGDPFLGVSFASLLHFVFFFSSISLPLRCI